VTYVIESAAPTYEPKVSSVSNQRKSASDKLVFEINVLTDEMMLRCCQPLPKWKKENTAYLVIDSVPFSHQHTINTTFFTISSRG
jgi:hypothetical protein